jgi:hypothetical protein
VAAGISFDAELVAQTTVDRIGGYRAMQQILRLKPRPTAVFAVNNMTAMGAMQMIREAGLSVPRDIALVCFDDVEHLAVLSPFMTVIDQPAETFGTLAVQLLLERIAGRAGERPRVVVLQPNLIVRLITEMEATGLPPSSTSIYRVSQSVDGMTPRIIRFWAQPIIGQPVDAPSPRLGTKVGRRLGAGRCAPRMIGPTHMPVSMRRWSRVRIHPGCSDSMASSTRRANAIGVSRCR